MSPTIANKRVTLPFAHDFEKSYETLVPHVSSWSKNIRKRQTSRLRLDVHLLCFHNETLELLLHILLENMSLVKNWHRQLALSRDCFTTYLKQQDEKTIYLQTALLKSIQ